MIKKWLSSLMALVLMVMTLAPAGATLTNSSAYTRYFGSAGTTDQYTALITAASNDTTATADSNVIDNRNGDVKRIAAGVKATNQTGTSPTLTVSLIGSFDNATWFTIQTNQGGTAGTTSGVTTSALSISSASTTAVSTAFDSAQFNLSAFTIPYLKVRIAVGGSSTPGWTGVAYASVVRGK